jgi:hypothetical protein
VNRPPADPGAVGIGRDRIARAERWLPSGALRWDLATVVAVAAAVQLLFPDRADWAAHVLSGGALVIVVGALLSTSFGLWSTTIGSVMVAAAAVIADSTVVGPFDPSDVAFTLAGALVVTGGASTRRDSTHKAVVWGLALLGAAVYYRYGIRRGP